MLAVRFIRRAVVPDKIRHFSRNTAARTNKPATGTDAGSPANTGASSSTTSKSAQDAADGVIGAQMHFVSPFDRFVLVWVKRYPNKESVPKEVTRECMYQALTRARVLACNYMIVFVVSLCAYVIWKGKQHVAQNKGNEEIDKLRQYYKTVKEENAAEAAAATATPAK